MFSTLVWVKEEGRKKCNVFTLFDFVLEMSMEEKKMLKSVEEKGIHVKEFTNHEEVEEFLDSERILWKDSKVMEKLEWVFFFDLLF